MLKKNPKIQNKTRNRLRLTNKFILVACSFCFLLLSAGIALVINLSDPSSSFANGSADIHVVNVDDQEFSNEFTIATPEIKQLNAPLENTVHIKKLKPLHIQ